MAVFPTMQHRQKTMHGTRMHASASALNLCACAETAYHVDTTLLHCGTCAAGACKPSISSCAAARLHMATLRTALPGQQQ
jgi:hypothetical protein